MCIKRKKYRFVRVTIFHGPRITPHGSKRKRCTVLETFLSKTAKADGFLYNSTLRLRALCKHSRCASAHNNGFLTKLFRKPSSLEASSNVVLLSYQ